MSNELTHKKPKVVVAPEGCPSYLKAGKEYKVFNITGPYPNDGYHFEIFDEFEEKIHCFEKDCGHLRHKDWIIKETEL